MARRCLPSRCCAVCTWPEPCLLGMAPHLMTPFLWHLSALYRYFPNCPDCSASLQLPAPVPSSAHGVHRRGPASERQAKAVWGLARLNPSGNAPVAALAPDAGLALTYRRFCGGRYSSHTRTDIHHCSRFWGRSEVPSAGFWILKQMGPGFCRGLVSLGKYTWGLPKGLSSP